MKDDLIRIEYNIKHIDGQRYCCFYGLIYKDGYCPACQTFGCIGYQMYHEVEMYK